MMRMGELLSRGQRRGMRASQCELLADHAVVTLHRHKVDQRATELPVFPPDTEVLSAREYLDSMMRQAAYAPGGPLFQDARGAEPSIKRIVALLRSHTPTPFLKCAADRERITGHSLRAGACFSALTMGVPLQLMDRWRSDKSVTRCYDRNSAEQVMQAVQLAARIDPGTRPNRVAPYVQI